ncbi:MAG: tryptophan--tRNA ligase [Thermoplasmata archaeon]|nr:tryptophan--tRNA ligase [Euryarchaeota archaeon]RLF67300.1 MAG: tryptophan--tRNA ligase [Thermoplasmata archaeon]
MPERIDPWGSSVYENYERLIKEFGISPMSELVDMLPRTHRFFTRGIIFGHRGFEVILGAIKKREEFVVLTGFSPSGSVHFGHKMTFEQIAYYQSLGADAIITIADLEALAARGMPLSKGYEIGINEYVKAAIALGLDPERTEFYFQSKRKDILDMAIYFATKVKLGEMASIYGFEESTSVGHVMVPLIQAGDILHVQWRRYKPRPTIVPVGVDQDPHIRLSRDLVNRSRVLNVRKFEDGVMVTLSDRSMKELLKKVEKVLREYGYSDLDVNIPYGVIKVYGVNGEDEYIIEKVITNIERPVNDFALFKPSATYHRLMRGLTGSKMSSSKPETAIFLTDEIEEAKKKVFRAVTGGRVTAEEQRKYGGNPDVCPVYELYAYHLVEDDTELLRIREECLKGERLCGHCKREAAELLESLLKDIREKMSMIDEKVIKEVVRYD